MARRNIVVVGASAGGIDGLKRLTEILPKDFPAAIFVVLHIPADSPSLLNLVLGKNSKLPVTVAKQGETIRAGHIYVAPPNQHLLLKNGFVELSQGPKENHHRPAVDPLFRSASRHYGNRAIAIVLSGMLDDGSAGLVAIKREGGVCIVQDPEEALFPSMPQNAIDNAEVDHVVSIKDMASLLLRLVSEEIEERRDVEMPRQEKESEKAMSGSEPTDPGTTGGRLMPVTCPDCGGSLWEKVEGKNVHFQCHVGHAYSPQSLVEGNSEALEEALWMALRIIQERITICKELATIQRPGANSTSVHYVEEAKEAEARANLLRSVLYGKKAERATENQSDLT